ncbi:unnamed protein product, partial [Porites evermanni]
MQKPLRDKRDLPSPTSTGARWWSRASSSSAPPGIHFSGEHRQQQERKKYSQVHCYLEELMVKINVTSMVKLASTSSKATLPV